MLATFCLRLSCGLAGALLLLSPAQVNPRFYRAQFLIILGLTAAAAVAGPFPQGIGPWLLLGLAMGSACLGSIIWSLEGQPRGTLVMGLSAVAQLAMLLTWTSRSGDALGNAPSISLPWIVADELTSAALLGSATSAMLIGHSYLVAPAMSMTPLLRLLAAWLTATLLRMGLAALGLWSWTSDHSFANLEDETVLWLPLRWGLGFLVPLVLGWMAWQTAKIRSTQSATGILYVVVIFCFLGELTSQLLLRSTGLVL